MEVKERDEIQEYTRKHLQNLAASTFTTCPSLTRFYLLKKQAIEEKRDGYQTSPFQQLKGCPYCTMPYHPDHSRMRLLPKMKLTSKVKRLLKKHTEKPGSLGKFQQKLVNDFINGRNRLAITCLQCKKTLKIPGQTRQDKFRQTQQKVDDTQSVLSDIPKTRKEKIKEKKKRYKRRKKEGKVHYDSNAGLKINRTRDGMEGENDQQVSGFIEETMPQVSANQKTEQDSLQNMIISSQKHSDKSIQNLLYRETSSKYSNINSSQKVNKVKPGVASWILSSKKKKGKGFTQQLGDILKQEENKTTEGSLADFLSSI